MPNIEATPIRCLMAMLGADVHSRGIRTLSRLIRDRGVEVIYLGEHNATGAVVKAAIEEGVDVVGLSFSSPAYVEHMRNFMEQWKAQQADASVMVGGLIHRDDFDALEALGVDGVFDRDSSLGEILAFLERASGKSLPPPSA